MSFTELNSFEKDILAKIIEANQNQYPLLKFHVDRVLVSKREFTGVGVFVHFSYIADSNIYKKISNSDCSLSSKESLFIQGLKFPVNYELNLKDGRLDFLEIVTNGETLIDETLQYSFEE